MPSYDMEMHNNWLRREVKEERIAVEHPILEVSQSDRSGGTAARQFPPQEDLNLCQPLPSEGSVHRSKDVQSPLFL
jgi:hypothetical protein